MLLLDIIFYSACKCEFGPNDNHFTAKCVTSVFVLFNWYAIANWISNLLFHITLEQLFRLNEEQFRYVIVVLGAITLFFISYHYNNNMNDVEKAGTIMRKYKKDTVAWHILVNIIAFVEPFAFGVLVNQYLVK